MSTTLNDNDRILNRVTNTYIHSDSIIETSPASAPVNDENGQSLTWVDLLAQLDCVFSGGLLRLHIFALILKDFNTSVKNLN